MPERIVTLTSGQGWSNLEEAKEVLGCHGCCWVIRLKGINNFSLQCKVDIGKEGKCESKAGVVVSIARDQ